MQTRAFAVLTGAALLVMQLAVPAAGAQNEWSSEHWVATWGTAQTLVRGTGIPGRGAAPPPAGSPAPPPRPAAPARRFPIPPALPGVSNQTVRMVVRASVAGRLARIRVSNAFQAPAVKIGAARIARSRGAAAIDPRTSRVLTFSGNTAAVLYAGQVLVSDPVDLAVSPLEDLTVSLYFPGDTGAPTNHLFGLRTTYVAGPGDVTAADDIATPSATTQSYYWLAGVDVLARADAATVVTFGDSITDGDQSTPEMLKQWPTLLAARLQAHRATAHVGVVNAGISGNRILGDNGSGLARLSADALDQPGVRWITLLEGINDITAGVRQHAAGGPPLTSDELIAAYKQVIELAHLRGIRVAGCTLTPFGGSSAYSDEGESIRVAVNTWIRSGAAFDAVIDFDRAVRDPATPSHFRPEADSPDLLHPGDAGYKMMADAVDLRIFRPAVPRGSGTRKRAAR